LPEDFNALANTLEDLDLEDNELETLVIHCSMLFSSGRE
jgi:hypothetical protein